MTWVVFKWEDTLSFFYRFRIYDEKTHSHTWDRVTKLEKGVIYYEGTVKILQNLTGWRGHKVLYFGDHPYSDLADVTLEHGWRTGAIINELSVRFCVNFIDLFPSIIILLASTKLTPWTIKNLKEMQIGFKCWRVWWKMFRIMKHKSLWKPLPNGRRSAMK